MPSQDDVIRLSIYLGIPAQEFRSVQGNLAKLVGDLLQLAYLRRNDFQEAPEFHPLLEGASTYSSVFGYWTSEDIRVDDHSEVIEFLVRPDNSAPIELLIISEVVFPALFLARQREILLVIDDGQGSSKRLRLAQLADVAVPTRLAPGHPDTGPRPIDPIRWISLLLSLLTDNSMPQGRTFWENGHLEVLTGEFLNWKRAHSCKPWFLQALADFDPEIHQGLSCEIELPTTYIRLLLHASCWWIFFGLSKRLRLHYRAWRDFWNDRIMRSLIEELDRVLIELKENWIEGEKPYFHDPSHTGPESDDPLGNATLWLAFVHDYLIFCFPSEETPVTASRDPLLETEPMWNPVRVYLFNDFMKALFRGRRRVRKVAEDPTSCHYWLYRLDILAKLNDRHFPDTHLLHAWRLLFRFLRRAKVFPLAPPSGPLVAWEKQMGAGAQVDWWTETFRIWSNSSTTARMWLSPLILDAVEEARAAIPTRKAKRSGASNRSDLSGRSASEVQRHEVRVERSVLNRVDREAIAGFPVKIEGVGWSESRVRFLSELQNKL